MRKILFLSLLFAATMLSAQSPVELPLWPDGAPNTNGLTGEQEDLKGGRVANVPPSFHNRLPSGKAQRNGCHYVSRRRIHPSCHEPRRARHGSLVHDAAGHHVCGIEVPHAERAQRSPLSDAEQAIRLVRKNMPGNGVSTPTVSVHGSIRRRTSGSFPVTLYGSDATCPDFQIPFPVISMLKGVTHSVARQTYRRDSFGRTGTEILAPKGRYSSQKTPQAFIIMLSADDATVPPINGIGYFLALREQKVPRHTARSISHRRSRMGLQRSHLAKAPRTGELEKWLRRTDSSSASPSTASGNSTMWRTSPTAPPTLWISMQT